MDKKPETNGGITPQVSDPHVGVQHEVSDQAGGAALPDLKLPTGLPDLKLPTGHPTGLWFFFWGELAERSSYYGMRAILFLYMTKALMMPTAKAGPTYAGFKAACYLLPLLGGFIADRLLGRYWTIVGFSVPYVLGQFLVGIPNEVTLFIALALLAGGSGVIKPNISTLMGETYDEKRPGQARLRTSAFLWFYFAINVGALLSQVALPEVRQRYILSHLTPELRAQADALLAEGKEIFDVVPNDLVQEANRVAFAVPAWLMVGALLVFALGKPFYAHKRPEHRVLTPEERSLQWKTLGQLFGIFGLVVLFWFGYEHNDSLWISFISNYVDLRVPLLNKTIAPDQLQFLNALFVLLSIPTLDLLYRRFDPQVRIFTPVRKVLAGFLLTAAAVGIMSVAAFLVQGHTQPELQGDKLVEVATTKVSVFWPVAAYIVLTLGEVLVYGTMLELAYTAAPKSMKGFITACFLLTNTVANFLNMAWTPLYASISDEPAKRGPLLPGTFFGITALVTLAAAVAFIFVGKRFERSQTEAAAAGVI
jgi:POT family proton-dependent oligopeptide transporter